MPDSFRLLLGCVGGACVAIDASALAAVEDIDGAHRALFGGDTRDTRATVLLDDEPQVVTIAADAMHHALFALPPLLEELEGRGAIAVLRHEGILYTVVHPTARCLGGGTDPS